MVVEAEKYKAALTPPTGNEIEMSNTINNLTGVQVLATGPVFSPPGVGTGLSDDDFFHLTCHIDPSLRSKIERGEYVDLERLLLKEREASYGAASEGRLEWVQKDGHTYLAPASDYSSKITGIRKWEQAFCVYATIYCGANPGRSKEIWQYVSVINTAVASFHWENVANYDFTFRHLMAFNPQHSWALTYNQMWNLSMKDPIVKRGNSFTPPGNGNFQNKKQGQGKRMKSDYCWSYNKGIKCKFGNKCKFIERCSYCDAGNHSAVNCPKLAEKKGVTADRKE